MISLPCVCMLTRFALTEKLVIELISTETLYWNAGVKTDEDGKTSVEFALNDSVTSFRASMRMHLRKTEHSDNPRLSSNRFSRSIWNPSCHWKFLRAIKFGFQLVW